MACARWRTAGRSIPAEFVELVGRRATRGSIELGDALRNGDTTREFERGFTMLLDGLRRLIDQ